MRKTYYISKNPAAKPYSVRHVFISGRYIINVYSSWMHGLEEGIGTDGYLIEDKIKNKDWILLDTLKGNIIDKFDVEETLLEEKIAYDYKDGSFLRAKADNK